MSKDLQYTEGEYRCIRAMASMLREFRMLIAESERAQDIELVVGDIKAISDESIEED